MFVFSTLEISGKTFESIVKTSLKLFIDHLVIFEEVMQFTYLINYCIYRLHLILIKFYFKNYYLFVF